MEVQILHYYLKLIINSLVLLFLLFFLYLFNSIHKELDLINNFFTIQKGEKIDSIIKTNINVKSEYNFLIFKLYYILNKKLLNNYIHYGDFYIDKNINYSDLLKIITKPSNVLNKITIIEGWSKKELEKELSIHFDKPIKLPYEDIIADTYFFEKNKDIQSFKLKLENNKKEYFSKYEDNLIFKSYSINQIMTIGSLIEKEGLDINDKRKISSVILNRLNKNMKLQIDASVIFAVTNGNYELKRKLLLSDLKINHPYNTYLHHGLPPKPISYVGKETLDIIFENYKTDFLFYFFNNSLKRHIFSENYNEHLKKLNEYRNKK